MNLKNKVVLVTGSSSGIGQTTAIRFAKEGAHIIVHYHENKEGGEQTLAEIKKHDVKGLLVQANMTKSNDIEQLFQTVLKEFGTLDILINNAAIPTDKIPFMEASPEDIIEMINADLVGPMLCAQHAVKIMDKQGYGKILNTSSVRGAEHGGRAPVYAASKAGINSFTKTLAKQVAPKISVNAVGPGFVKTRSYDKMSKEQIDNFLNQTYLKRFITQDEIADTFIFLAKNDGITGQVIYVDGGFLLK